MQKDALEKTCYVGGAGAFGVFIRWLQTQIAFNDDGLPDASFFNVLVPLAILAAGALFFVFVRRWRERNYYLPGAFQKALENDGLLFSILRWFLGALMAIGAILLFASSEADKNVGFYRVLAVLGLLAGASFPYILGEANMEEPRRKIVSVASLAPMLLYAFWLVTCYKVNSINGVLWAYGIEVIACCVILLAFFRMAGFIYSSADAWNSLFFCMFGAADAVQLDHDQEPAPPQGRPDRRGGGGRGRLRARLNRINAAIKKQRAYGSLLFAYWEKLRAFR